MEAPVGPVRGNRSCHRCPSRHKSGQISDHGRLGTQKRERQDAQGPHGGPRILLTHRRPEPVDVLRMSKRVLAQHDIPIRIVHVDARADPLVLEDLQHLGGNRGAEGVPVERRARAELPADRTIEEHPRQGNSVRLHHRPGAPCPAACGGQHRDRGIGEGTKRTVRAGMNQSRAVPERAVEVGHD